MPTPTTLEPNSATRVCIDCGKWKNLHINANGRCPRCQAKCDDPLAALHEESRIDRIGQNGNTGDHYRPQDAANILGRARSHLRDRATTYDTAGGERSMAKAVAIFNAATSGMASGGVMKEREGWLFMVCLKIARSTQPGHNPDDYEDLAAYAALYGEASQHGG